jgi:hypothetical protein
MFEHPTLSALFALSRNFHFAFPATAQYTPIRLRSRSFCIGSKAKALSLAKIPSRREKDLSLAKILSGKREKQSLTVRTRGGND